MSSAKISIDNLKRFSILAGLDDEQLKVIEPVLKSVALKNGEVLFHEGEESNEVYLVARGSVDICKSGFECREDFVIANMGAGEVLGELAFLDGSPRSALVKAAEDSLLLVMEKEQLLQVPFSHLIIANLAKASSEKLRDAGKNYVTSLEKQVRVMKTQHDFGQFFTYIMTLMAIGMIINNLMNTYFTTISPYSLGFFIFYSVILLVPSLIIVWKLKMPLRDMGVTLKNWKRSLVEGLICCGIMVALFKIVISVALDHGVKGIKPFTLPDNPQAWFMMVVYLVHTALQELFARGFLQTSFERFFNDKTGVRSIFFASLLFGLFHLHFGIAAVLVIFVSSLFFGAIYHRHRNLIGVSLIHYVAGVWGFTCGVL